MICTKLALHCRTGGLNVSTVISPKVRGTKSESAPLRWTILRWRGSLFVPVCPGCVKQQQNKHTLASLETNQRPFCRFFLPLPSWSFSWRSPCLPGGSVRFLRWWNTDGSLRPSCRDTARTSAAFCPQKRDQTKWMGGLFGAAEVQHWYVAGDGDRNRKRAVHPGKASTSALVFRRSSWISWFEIKALFYALIRCKKHWY